MSRRNLRKIDLAFFFACVFSVYFFLPCFKNAEFSVSAQDVMSVEECMEVVKEFDEQFWGLEVDVDEKRDKSKIAVNDNGPEDSVLWFRVAQSADGSFARTVLKLTSDYGSNQLSGMPKILVMEQETCYISGQQVKVNRYIRDGQYADSTMHGWLDYSFKGPMSLGGSCCYLVGISEWDRERLSDLAMLPNATNTISDAELDGEAVTVLSCDIADRGHYEFFISKSTPHLVRKFTIQKGAKPGQCYVSGDGEIRNFGQKSEKDSFYLDRYEATFWAKEYQEYGGRHIVKKGRFIGKMFADGSSHEMVSDVEVTKITRFDNSDNTRAVFEYLSVDDGKEVSVAGQDGVSFVFRDGRVERNLDSDAIGVSNGVRFRKPVTNRRPAILLVALFCVVGLLVWHYKKRNRR